MRITSRQLRRIIREEAHRLLREAKETKANTANTLLVFQTDDGYLEYFVGSEDAVGAFVESGGRDEPKDLGLKRVSIGNDRAWDNYNNGGPHPVAKWLKKHVSITKILDQEYPDPFGATEFFNVSDWIAEKEDAEFEG